MFEKLFIPANYFFNPYSIPPGVAGLLNLAVGLFVFFRNRHSFVNLAFLILAFDLSIWLLGGAALYSMKDPELGLYLNNNIEYAAVIGIIPCFLLLAISVVGKFSKYKNKFILIVISAYIFYLFLSQTNLIISNIDQEFWGNAIRFGWLGKYVFLPWFAFGATAGFLILRKGLSSTKNVKKKKTIRTIMIAGGIGFVASADHLQGFGLPVYPFGYAPVTIYALIIAYTVIRHNVLDITSTVAANTIVRTIPDALLVTDPEMNIVFVNEGSAEILGYSKEELENMSLSKIIGKSDTEILSTNFDLPDSKKDLELDLLASDGRKIPVSISAADIEISDKMNAGRVIVAKDMRRMHDLVASLKNSTEELKQKVGELEHFNKITIDRELKMIELKKKLKVLEKKVVS